jgi:hypothetical protein
MQKPLQQVSMLTLHGLPLKSQQMPRMQFPEQHSLPDWHMPIFSLQHVPPPHAV